MSFSDSNFPMAEPSWLLQHPPESILESKTLNEPLTHEPSWVRESLGIESARQTGNSDLASESKNCCCCGCEVFGRCCPTDPFLWWFVIFHLTSGIVAFFSACYNVRMLFHHSDTVRNTIIRVYVLIFCCGMILLEIDFKWFSSQLSLMNFWIIRGLFYVFVGLQMSMFYTMALLFHFKLIMVFFISTVQEDISSIRNVHAAGDLLGFAQCVYGVLYIFMVYR